LRHFSNLTLRLVTRTRALGRSGLAPEARVPLRRSLGLLLWAAAEGHHRRGGPTDGGSARRRARHQATTNC
jgi:hypothetical protein